MFGEIRAALTLYQVRRRKKMAYPTDDGSRDNKTYRRIVIIDTTKCKVIMDKCLIGPRSQENHLREIFANTPALKGIKGGDLEVKATEIVSFYSDKE